ncbi:MAG: acyl-CoA dehydrogenase family protein [Chloroflexota bacterium]
MPDSPGTSLTPTQIQHAIDQIASEWATQRAERQRRRSLDADDFERLRGAGFHVACLPVDHGGLWESHARSSRMVFELLRSLAHGDSSVALVAAMHPLVLSTGGWLGSPTPPEDYHEAWEAQRTWVFDTVHDGAWWGTMISEPGTGGDPNATRIIASRDPARGPLGYRISGQKHFGSGSGIKSFMITNARPEGEAEPDLFFFDVRGVPWDGSRGLKLTAAWDGHGMTATQSHAMELIDCPVTRVAWPSALQRRAAEPRPVGVGFIAVIVGIVQVAVETARNQLRARRDAMRPFERVEWARVESESWLIDQAYEGVIRAAEQLDKPTRASRLAKHAIAELAESVLGRICRVVGGGAFSRHSPYGFWFEDVRALGFLRPPWGAAYDELFAGSWGS